MSQELYHFFTGNKKRKTRALPSEKNLKEWGLYYPKDFKCK